MKILSMLCLPFILATTCLAAEVQNQQYLADRHVARGIACKACHEQTPPKDLIKQDKCFACHQNYEKLATKTENLDINPHRTHMGEVECMACHSGHGQGEMVCNECHKFPNKVP